MQFTNHREYFDNLCDECGKEKELKTIAKNGVGFFIVGNVYDSGFDELWYFPDTGIDNTVTANVNSIGWRKEIPMLFDIKLSEKIINAIDGSVETYVRVHPSERFEILKKCDSYFKEIVGIVTNYASKDSLVVYRLKIE